VKEESYSNRQQLMDGYQDFFLGELSSEAFLQTFQVFNESRIILGAEVKRRKNHHAILEHLAFGPPKAL
jgi:hypothetical protein